MFLSHHAQGIIGEYIADACVLVSTLVFIENVDIRIGATAVKPSDDVTLLLHSLIQAKLATDN